jgi:hypothetical protein
MRRIRKNLTDHEHWLITRLGFQFSTSSVIGWEAPEGLGPPGRNVPRGSRRQGQDIILCARNRGILGHSIQFPFIITSPIYLPRYLSLLNNYLQT